jgi:Mg-chelatase subunit ChlD
VAVTPDLAPTLGSLVAPEERSGAIAGCEIVIKSVEPANLVSNGPAGANVWIPDSSLWAARALAAGVPVPAQSPSIATSPVVLALSGTAAARLTGAGLGTNVAGILATRQTANPLRVGLPDPQGSAATIAAVLAAEVAVAGTPDARAALTWALRSSPPGLPTGDNELLERLATDPGTVVPVSEQAMLAHNLTPGATQAVAAYPVTGGSALDYPVVPLAADPNTVEAAGEITKWLDSGPARAALLQAGFRAPDGSPGTQLTAASGVDPSVRMTAPLPATQQVDDALRSVEVSNEPSRMLAVIDISGSMQAQVPGANGATRIDLAKAAAGRGLALYSADSDIGLWVFSTNLAMGSDHRELIPVSTLGPDGQGGSGAQRLAQALGGISAIPNGGTGLYDTTLDAVRTMRAGWDPSRVNAVLILSDGMNDDDNSISLDSLLTTLTAEQDPSKPVPVISIAFGPDSDIDALNQISRATGGASYQSQNPLQIGEIFLDAVGQRLCRPSC